MSTLAKFAAAAALVLAGAAALWWAMDAVRSPVDPAASESPAAPPAALARMPEDPLAGPAEETLAEVPAPEVSEERHAAGDASGSAWTIRERVLRADGVPMAGVRVAVQVFDGYEVAPVAARTAEVVTDGGGRYAWALEAPDGAVLVRAQAQGDGFRGWPASELVQRGQAAPTALDRTTRETWVGTARVTLSGGRTEIVRIRMEKL